MQVSAFIARHLYTAYAVLLPHYVRFAGLYRGKWQIWCCLLNDEWFCYVLSRVKNDSV